MHILLTNDDGPPDSASSPYISTFVKILQSPPFNHAVSVVLPSQQRSWIGKAHLLPPSSFPKAGQQTSRSKNEEVEEVLAPTYYDPKSQSISESPPNQDDYWVLIPGTPSTCVQIGLFHHNRLFPNRFPSSEDIADARESPFDIVLSGPNFGRNTAAAFALSSGTLGGALEAAVCGVRAIALSFAFFTREEGEGLISEASTLGVKIIEKLIKNWNFDDSGETEKEDTEKGDKQPDLYSINIPLVPSVSSKQIHWTWMLSNKWSSSCLYKPVTSSTPSASPPSPSSTQNEEENTDQKSEEKKKNKETPKFKWQPTFGDVWKTIESSPPGNDGLVIRQKCTSVTPLKANYESLFGVGGFRGEFKL